jgi:ABC-2 type transport system permease protein
VRRALGAEWIKLRSVQATWWSLLALVAVTIAVSVLVVASASSAGCEAPCGVDQVRLSLSGAVAGQAAVIVLAVLAVGSEYDNGLIRTTLAAQPRRMVVLTAKVVVTTGLVTLATGLTLLCSWLLARAIFAAGDLSAGATLSATAGAAMRAYGGTVLYLVLVALLAAGIAAAVRDTPAALTAALTLLYAGPIIATFITDETWRRRIERFAPTAGLSIQATGDLEQLPIQPWPGLGVLAAYTLTALLIGYVSFCRRDALGS